jgi:hypothetical protein
VSNRRAIAVSAVFTAFLVVTYLGVLALGQIRLPSRPDPPGVVSSGGVDQAQ